ncbi:MAG: hypothetical protein DMD37_08300 [Gemmatimonadetes bacterium]|nr:MAG: hypothetical protein DMD71_05190 [Gemmatimonadota bacterium]PYP62872.1 MAG: hypothetical protein DMD37_08300 [Gemmatimonadota bacterium]
MNIDNFRRAVLIVGLALPMSWTAGSVAAQTARSYGVKVSTPTINQTASSAVLPPGGDMVTNSGQSIVVGSLVTAQDAFAIVTGDADATDGSNAVSSATLGAVSLLSGLITADGVVAVASSTIGGNATGSDAEGSSLANLVVNGESVSYPAPNTWMALPGVGYVVLNEQIPTGDGVTTSGITVNMIHVVLLDALTGVQTGEIIIGSASSAVGN